MQQWIYRASAANLLGLMVVIMPLAQVLAQTPYYPDNYRAIEPAADLPVEEEVETADAPPVGNDEYYTAPGGYVDNDEYYTTPDSGTYYEEEDAPASTGGCNSIGDSPACLGD